MRAEQVRICKGGGEGRGKREREREGVGEGWIGHRRVMIIEDGASEVLRYICPVTMQPVASSHGLMGAQV